MRNVVAVVAALVLLVAGCSGDEQDDTTTTAVVDERSALSDFVLAEESVASIAGFEAVTAQPLDEVQVFENPDPRGPCGGETPPPPIAGTAGRSFTAPALSLVQVVAEGDEVDEFFDAQLADIGDPCGPYESTTDADTAQTVEDVTVVALPQDIGYFSTARIVTEGQTLHEGSVLLRIDGVTSLVFVVSLDPIPLSSMESLTLLIDAELRSA